MPEKKWRRDGQGFSSADDEPIKFDRYRFAGNSNSSSMDETRKNRVIVGTTGTLHALSLSLSLDNRTSGGGKYSKNHYRRNFHTFRNSLGKAFNPREEKMRRSEGERGGRRRLKRQKEQRHEQLFDFRTTLPLSQRAELREKVGSLLLLSPVVTVYSDFHPVFFTRSLLCFSNLPTPASSNNCYSTPPLAKQFAERAHLVSRPRDPTTTGNFLPLLSFETAIPLSPRSESNRFSTLCSLFATSLRLVARSRISA